MTTTKYWVMNVEDGPDCAFYTTNINEFTQYVTDPEHYYTWIEY